MSGRLKQLRDLIEAAPGKPAEYARWHAILEAEIAEREAPPPVLEGALAEIVKHARAALSFVRLDAPEQRQPSMGVRLKGAASELDEAIASLEALALRGARPATRAEWLAIALDLAQDEGGVTEGLARAVASMLPALVEHESVRGAIAASKLVGPWRFDEDDREWTRSSMGEGPVVFALFDGVAPGWRLASVGRHLEESSTLREAMLAADAALRSEGRILLGGLPEEVALEGASGPGVDGATCSACGGSGLRTRGVVVEACPVCGGRRTVPRADPPGPASGVEVRPERGEYQQEPFAPDDPQPDASWLQETTGLSLDRWWYRGTVPPVDVSITGASAFDVLLSWIIRRGLLASWREVPSFRGSYTVEIVTRAPLDLGAREGT